MFPEEADDIIKFCIVIAIAQVIYGVI